MHFWFTRQSVSKSITRYFGVCSAIQLPMKYSFERQMPLDFAYLLHVDTDKYLDLKGKGDVGFKRWMSCIFYFYKCIISHSANNLYFFVIKMTRVQTLTGKHLLKYLINYHFTLIATISPIPWWYFHHVNVRDLARINRILQIIEPTDLLED